MPFSSVNFLATLPILLVVYWLLPRAQRRAWLLVSSFVVYMWAGWSDLALLLTVTTANWASHRLAPRLRAARVAMIVFNVAALAWFKYRLFLADPLGLSTDVRQTLIIPLGLSFYVFQLISYQVEIVQGFFPACPPYLSFLLYIFFFPHHQAGPIMRPHKFVRFFLEGRRFRLGRFKIGLLILAWGLFKKIWIADFFLSGRVNALYGAMEQSRGARGNVFLLAVAYGLQIYADFSGYSDIAVGVGRLFGFKLDRNFHQPYLASGPAEFWRRWHVTLSQWLRDYLYIPLGGNRLGLRRTRINLLAVMLIGGLWHGAAWTFAFWGLLHGLYLLLERSTEGLFRSVPRVKFLVFQALIMLAWLPFRAHRAGDLLALVSRSDAWLAPETLWAAALFAGVIAFSRLEDGLERRFPAIVKAAVAVPDLALAAGCAAAALGFFAGIKYEVMFIYQRF
jgi:alginate O-acetyltransferase complex protein AlgI